jgi:hypothetical protein
MAQALSQSTRFSYGKETERACKSAQVRGPLPVWRATYQALSVAKTKTHAPVGCPNNSMEREFVRPIDGRSRGTRLKFSKAAHQALEVDPRVRLDTALAHRTLTAPEHCPQELPICPRQPIHPGVRSDRNPSGSSRRGRSLSGDASSALASTSSSRRRKLT